MRQLGKVEPMRLGGPVPAYTTPDEWIRHATGDRPSPGLDCAAFLACTEALRPIHPPCPNIFSAPSTPPAADYVRATAGTLGLRL